MTEFEDTSTPETTDTSPPPVDSQAFEASMDADMARVYDRMEKADDRQAHREAPLAPVTEATQPKDPLSATFEKAYDHLQMSKGEQDKAASEHAKIDEIRKFAADNGLTFQEAQAYKQAQQPIGQPGQLPQEFGKVAETSKALGYTEPLHTVAERWGEIDQYIRKDPIQGVAWLASQFDMNPLQLAQQLAVRFSDQTVLMSNAERMVDEFIQRTPGSDELQGLMTEALETGAVRRTGHMATDFQNAFNYAQRQAKKEGKARQQGRHIDRTMREAFDRANRK